MRLKKLKDGTVWVVTHEGDGYFTGFPNHPAYLQHPKPETVIISNEEVVNE